MRISDWSSDVCSSDLAGSGLEEAFRRSAVVLLAGDHLLRPGDFGFETGDVLLQVRDRHRLQVPAGGRAVARLQIVDVHASSSFWTVAVLCFSLGDHGLPPQDRPDMRKDRKSTRLN